MRWRDLSPAPGVGPWQGLDVEVAREDLPPGAPGLRVEAATPGRIRVTCEGIPAIWAHTHRFHYGLWRLIAPRTASWAVVPPLRAADVAAVDAEAGSEGWWKAWAREAARTLVGSTRSPLHPGRWAITAAKPADRPGPPVPGPPIAWTGIDRIEATGDALGAPALTWESWWLNGSRALLRMRDASPPSAGRVHAWVKRARVGALPPALALYVSGLDLFLLLDGHDRLRAAELTGAPLGFLVVWPARATERAPDAARQAAVMREIERKRELADGRRPLSVEAENRLLVDAFDDRPWVWPKTRAYPLAGGVRAWDAEVALQPGVGRQHAIFTGEPPPRE